MRDDSQDRPHSPPVQLGNMYLAGPPIIARRDGCHSLPRSLNGLPNFLTPSLFFSRRTKTWCAAVVVGWNVTQGFSGNRMVDGAEGCLW